MRKSKRRVALFFLFLFVPLAVAGSLPAPAAGQDDDLANMQRQVDDLNRDVIGKAAEALARDGVATDGSPIDPAALRKALARQAGGKKGKKDGEGAFGSPLYWFFMIFISIVGMGFFASGKRSGDFGFIASGLVMMVYPYFVADTLTLAGVGIALTIAPFLLKMR